MISCINKVKYQQIMPKKPAKPGKIKAKEKGTEKKTADLDLTDISGPADDGITIDFSELGPQIALVGIPVLVIVILIVMSTNTDFNADSDAQENQININEQSVLSGSDMQLDSNSTSATNAQKANKYSSAPEVLPAAERMGKISTLETDKGTIVIELFGDEAPLTVSNHIFLVEENFYDGLTFHRREEGFVIQGGDPLGSGIGGPGYSFEDEPVSRDYDRGIVAMANSGPDTNGSQFFIMLADNPLPPQYTIFGRVIEGLDVVDQIEIGDSIIKAEISERS